MGMYTDFLFDSELKKDVPEAIIQLLEHWLGKHADTPPEDIVVPDHPFFKTSRWRGIGWMGSYYFDAQPHRFFEFDSIAQAYTLNLRCNLKNYDSEIEKFIDWIKPYLNKSAGEFLGFSRYEECREPTLIFY